MHLRSSTVVLATAVSKEAVDVDGPEAAAGVGVNNVDAHDVDGGGAGGAGGACVGRFGGGSVGPPGVIASATKLSMKKVEK